MSLILLCLMIGIQQQNRALIGTSFIYLVIITWIQQWEVKDMIYIYSFVVFLILLLSWILLQKYPSMEDFGLPSRPCVMYFTTDKEGCDQGYYALPDTDFQTIFMDQATLLSNTLSTATNYTNEKQKYELLRTIAIERRKLKENNNFKGVCKQEFPGWLEDPDQPEKIPYETITKRGSLKDWAFCYQEVIPINTPTALYNPIDVANTYNKYISQFGEHNIAAADKNPFYQNPKNITGVTPYSKAEPEYARIYFKNWELDPDASCKNAAVKNVPSLLNLTKITSRYGIEIGFTSNLQNITSISTIRPSPVNGNQLLYMGDYNTPDLNIIEKLWFDYVVLSGKGLQLRPKTSIDTYIYRFYIDYCNRLMVPSQLPFNLKTSVQTTWNLSTFIGYDNTLLNVRDYPFGIYLPTEMIDSDWKLTDPSRKLVNILPYSTIKTYSIEKLRNIFQEQNNQLETYIQNIEDSLYDTTEILKNGLITKKYLIPSKYDNYRIHSLSDFIFDEDLPIYLENMRITLADKNGLTIPITTSTTESTYIDYNGILNITTPGKYEFKLVFSSTNILDYPVESTIVVEINNTMVASYFACKNYDECYSIFNVKCKKENECPIPLLSDLQNKKKPLIDNSKAVNNPLKIHNPIQMDLLNTQNILRIRVYTPIGTSSTPKNVYVLYRKVEDVQIVDNTQIANFRIIGNTANNIWKCYSNDSIQYRPYDIRPFIVKNIYATNRIQLNRNVLNKIETNRIKILKNFLTLIRKNPSKIINQSQKLISQNNRIYAFFTNPDLIPTTTTNDFLKIKNFNDNFKNII